MTLCFFPFIIKTRKCSGSCYNINSPYTKLCVPDVVKNLNVKMFNLVSGTNETRRIEWHKPVSVNIDLTVVFATINNVGMIDDKCECKCKELIDKNVCDKGFILNPSNCEYECYKSCDFSEYLDYKNCTCRKRLVDKLAEKCTENIDETRLLEITSTECKHNACTPYIVLFSTNFQFLTFTISVGLGICFLSFYWYLKKDSTLVKFDTSTQTAI